MISLNEAIHDPELGYTQFTVVRRTYRRQNGSSSFTETTFPASGCIHPGTPEMLQLLPEEDRHEEFIAVYSTDFQLSEGENPGGTEYTAPDRILYDDRIWKLVRLRDWSAFGYVQGLATLTDEVTT